MKDYICEEYAAKTLLDALKLAARYGKSDDYTSCLLRGGLVVVRYQREVEPAEELSMKVG
jgi:hypothetical protein